MLLDRIDIDAHGPLSRVELGPFSERLNVVCGPAGAGKTALARFIRDSLVYREYPLGMMSSSSGRVVWADRNGLLHCRREKDGTATGRRTVQFDPRGDFVKPYDSLQRSWISGITNSTDESRAAQSIQIPESIVDGVITDTAITSAARVVSACVRSGLDDPQTFEGLPLQQTFTQEDHHRRRSLRSQLADVEAELARLPATAKSHDQLVARRNELAARLATDRARSDAKEEYSGSRRSSRAVELEQRMERLRSRQSELRQSIADLEAAIANRVSSSQHYRSPAVQSDAYVRSQLDDLEAQLIRWRRALAEVRALRDALTHDAGYSGQARHGYLPSAIDDMAARRRHLDDLLHNAARHERTTNLRPNYGASHRLTAADVDHRIDTATRQIDWLLERYTAADPIGDWYRALPTSTYRTHSTLVDTLRGIRRDLVEIRHRARRSFTAKPFYSHLQRSIDGQIDELCQCEHWLSASLDQLMQHRESLLYGYDRHVADSRNNNDAWSLESLQRKLARRVSDLERVTLDLNDCQSRASQLRPSRDNADRWYDRPRSGNWIDRDAIATELNQIDTALAGSSRIQWLLTRRRQLMHELGVVGQQPDARSPLAEEASRWLVRLSAGRLRNVAWPYAAFKSASLAHSIHLADQPTGVCIDGRDEANCPAADRALTALAVRMAAGSLLAKTGRSVPLVLEIPPELQQVTAGTDNAAESTFHDWDIHGHRNHPIIAAINDYASGGRQVILLTSSQEFAKQIHHQGGRVFRLFADRLVHGHRPLWRPHYAPERYVGPHPHTYGNELAPDARVRGQEAFYQPAADRPLAVNERPLPRHHTAAHRMASVDEVNRSFDAAWREASGLNDHPRQSLFNIPATDRAPDGVDLRDGYYVSDSYTTVLPPQTQQIDQQRSGAHLTDTQLAGPSAQGSTRQASPFFLSVDSPIDQAPSIDAVAAARLRGLKVTHVTHLMQQDANRLADALGMSNIDAPTVRRWQSECRLCCRVPQLRGFDSRVLVGCGISDPAQLASIPPSRLLERVESFLTTESGQRILRTGSSHELSRITTWIATARGAANSRSKMAFAPGRVVSGRVVKHANGTQYSIDQDQDASVGLPTATKRSRRQQAWVRNGSANDSSEYGIFSATDNDDVLADGNGTTAGNESESGSSTRGSAGGNGSASSSRSRRSSRSSSSRSRSGDGSRRSRSTRSSHRRHSRAERQQRNATNREFGVSRQARSDREASEQTTESTSEVELKFYLHRESPVVDAPSIGAKMAERLSVVGIQTVDDLLNADPESLAEELGHRRVDAETIEAWQQQATLVCRIPMLRGHDAQLLVAAEYTTPEEVAESDPDEMFALIDPISHSSEGKRMIRGGKAPDLAEIRDWIGFAQQHRDLMAA